MDLNIEQAGNEADVDAQYEDYVGCEAQAQYEREHAAAEAHVADYEQRTEWIIEAAKNGVRVDPGGCRAGYEMALFQHEGVFMALAAFVFDDRNRAWHPEYRPMIEAGKKALEKAGWKS